MTPVFVTKYYCDICKKDLPLQVFGDRPFAEAIDLQVEEEAKKWGEHYHWTDNHRKCAVCGNLVTSGLDEKDPNRLNLVINQSQFEIHSNYEKETLPRAHGGQLLIVHAKCIKED